jgi:hypothetical protein
VHPLPLLRQGVLRFAFITAQTFFRAALSRETEGPRVDSWTRGAERCTGVTKRSVRRSPWRARAGGASATTYGAVKEEAVAG